MKDISAAISPALLDIGAELTRRLEGDLSDSDFVAITAALQKAGRAGGLAGAAAVAEVVEAQTNIRIDFNIQDALPDEPDVWQQMYGS
jgi:hypothetical protein